MSGCPDVTVVTMLVCFFIFARKAAGALSARHSLRPLVSWGGTYWQNPDAIAPRERGCSSLRGTAATKQSSFLHFSEQAGLLRFARNDVDGLFEN
jgi:hypothetical protein